MLTVRTRLTLGVLALLTVLVAFLSVVETLQLRGFLVDSAGTRLRAQAKPAVDEAAAAGLTPGRAALLATDLTSADTGASVLTPGGSVVGTARPGTVGAAPPTDVPLDAVLRAAGGEKEVDVVRPSGADRELLALVPLPGGDLPRPVVVLSTSLADEDATARRQLVASGAALLLVLAVAAVASPLLVRRSLRPLQRIAATAEDVAAGDLSQRVDLRGRRDEIGRLAESFDAMTAELESAFAVLETSERRSRAFVADASHELRTPLTTLAGFSDVLMRQHLDGDPERMTRPLASLRREVDRMQRIVDDLLLLARADGGLPGSPERTELRALAASVVEQVRPMADERRLVLVGDPVCDISC